MQERTDRSKKNIVSSSTFQKPVITISREYGCPGETIAERLTDLLTRKNLLNGGHDNWRWISKEIIEEAAKKLKLTPTLMDDLSLQKNRSIFENIALFFSDKFYPIDGKVQNTIAEFIQDTAIEGHVVMLGRASEIITHHFTNSLHIKLFAPIEHRTELISMHEGVSMSAAKKMCIENDLQRESFRKLFSGEKDEMGFYDVLINSKNVSENEILEMILIVSESRGFV